MGGRPRQPRRALPPDAAAAKVDGAALPPQPARDARWGCPTPTVADASGAEAFAARIAWQLAQHGAVAGLDAGEAFHLIDQL